MKKCFLLAICCALFALALPAAAAAPKKGLLIGLIPETNVFVQMERYKPLAAYLSEEIGIPVRLMILSRYGDILRSFTSEGMDGAFFGSFTGALAIQKLGVVPLARPVNLDGESTYRGLLYVRKESGIRSIRALKGKRFAFVEKATTAGYVFPLALLRREGISGPDGFFSEYYFTGSHDASILAVLDGKADGGAAKHSIYALMKSKEPRVEKELTVIAESPKVPSNGLCVRKDLDGELKKKLTRALLDLHATPRGREVLTRLRALRFIETTAEDYLPVHALAKSAGIDLRTYRYVND